MTHLAVYMDRRHPVVVTLAGIISGMVSLASVLTPIFGLIGAIAGAAVAVLSLRIKWRSYQAWQKRNRPPEEVDDVPL